jgi:hypothetical protein
MQANLLQKLALPKLKPWLFPPKCGIAHFNRFRNQKKKEGNSSFPVNPRIAVTWDGLILKRKQKNRDFHPVLLLGQGSQKLLEGSTRLHGLCTLGFIRSVIAA